MDRRTTMRGMGGGGSATEVALLTGDLELIDPADVDPAATIPSSGATRAQRASTLAGLTVVPALASPEPALAVALTAERSDTERALPAALTAERSDTERGLPALPAEPTRETGQVPDATERDLAPAGSRETGSIDRWPAGKIPLLFAVRSNPLPFAAALVGALAAGTLVGMVARRAPDAPPHVAPVSSPPPVPTSSQGAVDQPRAGDPAAPSASPLASPGATSLDRTAASPDPPVVPAPTSAAVATTPASPVAPTTTRTVSPAASSRDGATRAGSGARHAESTTARATRRIDAPRTKAVSSASHTRPRPRPASAHVAPSPATAPPSGARASSSASAHAPSARRGGHGPSGAATSRAPRRPRPSAARAGSTPSPSPAR